MSIVGWLKRFKSKGLGSSVRLLDFTPSWGDLHNACLSFRHDYGLLTPSEKDGVRQDALDWLRAWGHALPQFTAKKNNR